MALALLCLAAFILPSTVSSSPSKTQRAGGAAVWILIGIAAVMAAGGAHHGG